MAVPKKRTSISKKRIRKKENKEANFKLLFSICLCFWYVTFIVFKLLFTCHVINKLYLNYYLHVT